MTVYKILASNPFKAALEHPKIRPLLTVGLILLPLVCGATTTLTQIPMLSLADYSTTALAQNPMLPSQLDLTSIPVANKAFLEIPPPPINKLYSDVEILEPFSEGTSVTAVIVRLAFESKQLTTVYTEPASVKSLVQTNETKVEQALARNLSGIIKVKHKYTTVPGFSADVTFEGLQLLQNDPDVVAISPDEIVIPHTRQGIPLIQAGQTRSEFNGSGLAIAIVDTGVDYRHPNLGNGGFPNGKVIGGYDYGDGDTNPLPPDHSSANHGTACAGIAAGDIPPEGSVGDYIGGVAHAARIYALKLTKNSDPNQSSAAGTIEAAWDWCLRNQQKDPNNPIMIISTSFGGGNYTNTCNTGNYTAIAAACNAANITIFASSGNDGFCNSMGSPACNANVVAVGAVYEANLGTLGWCVNSGSCLSHVSSSCGSGRAFFEDAIMDKVTAYSNSSPKLSLLGSSNNAYTCDTIGAGGNNSGNFVTNFGGTSAACPYVAGAAACLQHAERVRIGRYGAPHTLEPLLRQTADGIHDPKANRTTGRVNLSRAIEALGSIYVDTTYTGPENGSIINPYNTFNDGYISMRPRGGTILMLRGNRPSTPGAHNITEPMTIKSYLGNAVIGQ